MENITEVINDYLGKRLEFGHYDCNLLIAEIYLPSEYKQMFGIYDSLETAITQARLNYGVNSLKELVESSNKFKTIPVSLIQPGDFLINNKGHDTAICTGSYLFGVVDKNFNLMNFENVDLSDFTAYRGI